MAVYRCPRCNQPFSSDVSGMVRCPACAGTVEVEEAPASGGAPWDRPQRGLFNAYVQTIRMSLGAPAAFFADAGRGEGIGRPLAFALINAVMVAVLASLYQLGFQIFLAGANIAVDAGAIASPIAALSAPLAVIAGMAIMVIALPIATAAGLAISSGIYHVSLMVLGAAARPFAQTFRVACYATGPQLLQILPLAGGLIAAVWQIVLTVMGLKAVHRTSYGKAVLAVFLPVILCCGVMVLFVSMIAGGIVGVIMSAAGG